MLDLTISAAGVQGSLAAGAAEIASRWDEPLSRHFLSFLALSVLESEVPLTSERVRASRRTSDGWELLLEPSTAGLQTTVVVSSSGELLARRYRYRGVGWSESFTPHRFESRGFSLTLREEILTPLGTEPDPSLFSGATQGAAQP